MKYAIVAAAIAGLAMAIPAEDWSNVKKCDPVTKTITTTECGDHKDAWDNCHVATKTYTETPKECPTKKPSGCKGGKYADGKECHDDDDEWENWPKGCKWGKDKEGKECHIKDDEWEPVKKPEPKKEEWEAVPKKEEPKKEEWVPVKEEKKCYATEYKTYTTKECGSHYDAWDNCKDVTKTKTETKTTSCTEWVPVTPTATWTAWVDVCAPVTKTYTTKECGDKKDAWDNCKDVTKTKTEVPATCTKKVESETWKVWTSSAPAKTPAATTTEVWSTWKASSTVSVPVAKWTGAADKQAVGFGALAIAAVAALL